MTGAGHGCTKVFQVCADVGQARSDLAEWLPDSGPPSTDIDNNWPNLGRNWSVPSAFGGGTAHGRRSEGKNARGGGGEGEMLEQISPRGGTEHVETYTTGEKAEIGTAWPRCANPGVRTAGARTWSVAGRAAGRGRTPPQRRGRAASNGATRVGRWEGAAKPSPSPSCTATGGRTSARPRTRAAHTRARARRGAPAARQLKGPSLQHTQQAGGEHHRT